MNPGSKDHALLLHDRQPAGQEPLLHLELGDAVAQQPADPVGALEDRDRVAGPVELVGGGQPGGSRPDDGHALAGPDPRRRRCHPSLVERPLDDRELDRLDRDRVIVDRQHARPFAGRGAETTRPFRKVVRGVQSVDGRLPLIPVHQVVPVRNEVPERTPLVAERDPTIHAAGALRLEIGHRVGQVHFLPVEDPFCNRSRRLFLPLDLQKALDLAHTWLLEASVNRRRKQARQTQARGPRPGHEPPPAEHVCSPEARP